MELEPLPLKCQPLSATDESSQDCLSMRVPQKESGTEFTLDQWQVEG